MARGSRENTPNLATARNKTIAIKNGQLIVSGSGEIAISGSSGITNLGTTTDKPASETYVSTQVANLVASAPSALNTLDELAAALGDDANFASTVTTSIGTKLTKTSNLSDLSNAATARTNLGLGTAATTAATAYATSAQGTKADSAYGWGNHASAGYLTSQTSHADVVVDGDFTSNGLMKRTGAGTYSIVTDNSTSWNEAYAYTSTYAKNFINVTIDTAAATAAKTATVSGYTLAAGDFIVATFTLGTAVSNPTLDINGAGAKNIRIHGTTNSNTTTLNIGAASTVLLYYDGTYFFQMGSYDSSDADTFDRVYVASNTQVGAAVYDYKILMEGIDGKYYPLTLEEGTGLTKTISTQEFRTRGRILYYNSTSNLAANATTSNLYRAINTGYLGYTLNQLSGYTAYSPVYLVFTLNANGNFVLDNSSYTSFFTQTLPTAEDGKYYMYLGHIYSTNDDIRLTVDHPVYEYKAGAVREVTPGQIIDIDQLNTSSGTPGNTTYLRGDGTWSTPPNTTYTASTGLTLTGTAFSVTTPTDNNFTSAYKTKLDGIAASANNYSLPTATASVLGGVKIGSGISISSGVISADSQTDNNFTTAYKNKIDGIASGATANTGTVTSVATGTGLTGGTITATGTISLSHLGFQNLTDPNADRIAFWDDSAGSFAWLTLGSNLSISGTTINATDTNTTYSVGDGGLTQVNFTTTRRDKLDGIASGADNYSSWTISDGTTTEAIASGNTLIIRGAGASTAAYDAASNTLTITSTDNNTTYSVGDGGLTEKNFTTALKSKLDGIAASANNYSLPTASATVLGGVKIGSGISISSGVISADSQTDNNFTAAYKTKLDGIAASANNYSLPVASTTVLGGVKAGTNISIDANGVISSTDTNTTYSVGDGGLTQKNFTTTLYNKLNGIAASADNYGSWTISDGTNSEGIGSGATLIVRGAGASSVAYDAASNTLTVSSTDNNTTYSVGDGGLTQVNFTTTRRDKLDGIESGATADQTASEILTLLKTVDGAGSGLDADLLDGNSSAAFATAAQGTKADTAYGWGNHASAGYLTSVTNISGYAGNLVSEDNRTISPSELSANRFKFGFTSWNNNNSSPYADFIHLRSYQDSSGGSDNLVMFKKSGIGMRIWQQSWGSSTAYSSYADVWTTSDFSQTSVNNWNTAYGWGNHASAGYITSLAGYATTNYVDTAVAGLVDTAPDALNTLNELAAALGDDPNFATTISNSIGTKLAKASNLSDLADVGTARTNLGLGSLATLSSVNAATITDNSVGAAELNVSGNGTTSQYLRSDGDGTFTWATPPDTNTTYSVFTSTANGLAPASGGGTSKYLRADGTWVVPPDTNTTYSVGNGGLTEINFTSALNTKLSGIATGADNYGSWRISDGTATEDIGSGAALIIRGAGASVSAYDAASNTLTITSTNTTYSVGDGGLTQVNFTTAFRDKLNGIAASANNYSLPTASATVLGGVKIGSGITITSGVISADSQTDNNFTTAYKNKIDGIEAGATADQTASEILTLLKTVDGAGSGLDADLLDGNSSAAFATSGQGTKADTAYGWGNHASAGYLTSLPGHDHNYITERSTITYGDSLLQWTDLSGTGGTGLNGAAPGNPFSDWFHHLIMNHANGAGYYVDIAACFHSDDMYFRRLVGGTLNSWRRLWHDGDFTSTNISNWNTAYGWGNHASAGYTSNTGTVTSVATNSGLTGGTITTTGTIGIATNGVTATHLNVSGNGTTAQYLRSDGDGSFTWATPTNTTYSVGDGGLTQVNFTTARRDKLDGISENADAYNKWWVRDAGVADQFSVTSNGGVSFRGAGATAIAFDPVNSQVIISSTDTNTDTTYSAGSGLSLSGTTFSHSDTSTQASVNNSGRTFIQDITLDTYGHITGIVSATDADTYTGTVTSVATSGGLTGGTITSTGTISISSDARPNSNQYFGNSGGEYFYFDNTNSLLRGYVNASERMRLDASGNVHFDGDVIAYSTTISDSRLKDNIVTIGGALDKVKQLRGVEYDWNAGARKGQHDIGLIAQEVEAVIPEVVREKEMALIDGNTYKTVDYEKLIGVLVEAMKEQQTQIEALQTEIEILKNK